MIYLVRHGQTDWNVEGRIQGFTDIPLNDVGRAQAAEVAKLVRSRVDCGEYEITHIFSSDLGRAAETARAIGGALGLGVVLDGRLREHMKGEMEGQFWSDEVFGEFRRHPEKFGAETGRQLFARCRAFLDELRAKNVKNALVVSHGGTIVMLAYAASYDEYSLEKYEPFAYELRGVKNCEIVEVAL